MGKLLAGAQQLGRALMLPIAVLPVAGLLLGLGQKPLVGAIVSGLGLTSGLLSHGLFIVANVMQEAGGAIFTHLPLIFAIGVAVGFARENHGSAALAGVVGYVVLMAVMSGINPALNMGVLAGILAGLVAGLLYNRYHTIELPSYLAFFGGKRFVPIASGCVMLILGIALGYIWWPVQVGINHLGNWLIGTGALGAFLYGVLNRLLIVTGLHHILNNIVWFQVGDYANASGVVFRGDLNRFFAGDKSAGLFMSGFFPVMMFGLPAACLAMYRTAKKENKKRAFSMLIAMALTALLTGVTEPIEFSFMFLAPVLYLVHALLTGLAMAVANLIGMKLGFSFSAGLFDYLLNFTRDTHPLWLIPFGMVYFVIYYGLFTFCIRRFNLKTLGREDSPVPVPSVYTGTERAQAFILALGGRENLEQVEACTTRLRLQVKDNQLLDEPALQQLGAKGVIRPAAGLAQVVLGPEADVIAEEIQQMLS